MVFKGVHECSRAIQDDSVRCRFKDVPLGFRGFQWITEGFIGVPGRFGAITGAFQEFSRDFRGVSERSKTFKRFSTLPEEFQGFRETTELYQVFCGRPLNPTKISSESILLSRKALICFLISSWKLPPK